MSEPREYLPKNPINIDSTDTSSAFVLVNNTSVVKRYVFQASQVLCVRRGYSDVSAATTADFRLPTNVPVFLSLMPNEGVRVIRVTSNGVLQIGDLDR